ncbi:MAG TPA: molybdate ABC transporter permease subunit, partial [Candidatus Eisenbacteria bacterium]|nr:molybdate ABC transporter permease subunit [Candidatus Eisenbacteria bacterium]
MSAVTTDLIQARRGPARSLGRAARRRAGIGRGIGVATLYRSLIVLIPLGAVVLRSTESGPRGFWRAITAPETVAALTLTVAASLTVVAVNVFTGTLIAWVLVRDSFPGRRVVDTLIDMPFALPTIVAGLVLLTLYGPTSPVGIDLAYERAGV